MCVGSYSQGAAVDGFSDNALNKMLIKYNGSIKRVVMDLNAGHRMRTLEFPVYHDRNINKCTRVNVV